MEFCQIQLNWFDWSFQNAKESVDILKEYDLPIWVMEPVRGGRLLNLDEKYTVRLNEMRPDRSLADWAFRFLLGIDSVTVVLSGMSDMEQLTENIDIFCDETKLSAEENNTLIEIGEEMGKTGTLPCTACRYCTSHCPQGLDIPDLISMYNQVLFKKGEADFSPHLRPSHWMRINSLQHVCTAIHASLCVRSKLRSRTPCRGLKMP